MSVENTSVRAQPLFFIKGSTVERNPMDVLNVGRHSAEVPSLCNTRESTLGKNLTNVLNVEKPLARILGLLIIRESILGRNLTNVFSVGNPIVKAQIFSDISEDTMQKNCWTLWKFKKLKIKVSTQVYFFRNEDKNMEWYIMIQFGLPVRMLENPLGNVEHCHSTLISLFWKKWCHTCLETEILNLIYMWMPKSFMWCLYSYYFFPNNDLLDSLSLTIFFCRQTH